MRSWFQFKYFYYASLVFLVWYLYKNNFLSADLLRIHFSDGITALVLLLAGFGFHVEAFRSQIKSIKYPVTFGDVYIGMNLSVFGKYIPGKVFVLHGISAYLYEKLGISRTHTATAFLIHQLLYLITGLLVGGFLVTRFTPETQWLAVLAFVGLGLFLFWFRPLMQWVLRTYSQVANKAAIQPAEITFRYETFWALLAQWLCWGIGFNALAQSFGISYSIEMILVYPFVAAVGYLAIFAPGGLGVREGLLTLVLRQQGLSLEEATTLATLSRLWFLTGEALLFLTALGWSRQRKASPQVHSR